MSQSKESELAARRAKWHQTKHLNREARRKKQRDYYHRTKHHRASQLRAYSVKRYHRYRESLLEKNKAWRDRNRDRIKAYYKNRQLRKRGLTKSDYDALLKDQNGGCAICGIAAKDGRRLSIDHCHRKGTIRGLLCDNCNCALGLFNDSIDNLNAAIRYLFRAAEKTNRKPQSSEMLLPLFTEEEEEPADKKTPTNKRKEENDRTNAEFQN